MTTAHRPTWAPAKGHEETGGARFFAPSERRMAKDLRAHTQLKYRQEGQGSAAELARRDLRMELAEREAAALRKRCASPLLRSAPLRSPLRSDGRGGAAPETLLLAPPGRLALASAAEAELVPRPEDRDDSDEGGAAASDDSDSDEDDTAALLAELEKIKAQRAEEAQKRESARAGAEAAERAEELATGNPLLHLGGGAEADFGSALSLLGLSARLHCADALRSEARLA
jgi:protein CWC15